MHQMDPPASPPILTHARETLSPYLPPPALKLIQSIDTNPQITTYIDHEPSMTIIAVFLSLYVVTAFIRILSFRVRGKAVEGLEDDEPEGNVLSNLNDGGQIAYDDSVVLFGPCGSGKSLMFHHLSNEDDDNDNSDGGGTMIHTVMSLKANVHVANGLRIVDYPGHITLSQKLPNLLSSSSPASRGVFVVDSTKSLAEAAELLYKSVLTNLSVVNALRKKGETMNILVACNKSDEAGSKNWRRIKIQLRNELDKLKKITTATSLEQSGIQGDGDATLGVHELTGKTIDLDDLSKNGLEMIKLNFLSLSARKGEGMKELKVFVNDGEVLIDNSSILKNRR